MAKSAIRPARTSSCPAWCNAHEVDADGAICSAKPVTITAGTISMQQIRVASDVYDASDEPTVWFNDEPLSLAGAAELAALLAGLVASALAVPITPTRTPAVSAKLNA